MPCPIYSSGENEVIIEFTSSSSWNGHGRGFNISWETISIADIYEDDSGRIKYPNLTNNCGSNHFCAMSIKTLPFHVIEHEIVLNKVQNVTNCHQIWIR
ncbi:unnamed protein product, partial [Meganyctiphanes norvegica]